MISSVEFNILSQSILIKNNIHIHQKSSPTPILDSINQLAKDTQTMIYELNIIQDEMRILQNTNLTLKKHQKTKKTYIQKKETLNQKKSKTLLIKKNIGKHIISDDNENINIIKKNKIIL